MPESYINKLVEAVGTKHQHMETEKKYKSAISRMERAILKKETVSNKVIGDKNLIVQLFRENGIEPPLKTQEWIKTALVQIYCNSDDNWTYRYKLNSGINEFIDDNLNKLVEAIGVKYKCLETEKEGFHNQKGKPSILGAITENKNIVLAQGKASDKRDKKEQTGL